MLNCHVVDCHKEVRTLYFEKLVPDVKLDDGEVSGVCGECFGKYGARRGERLLSHLSTGIPGNKGRDITEAYRRDVHSRRLAEDGRSVVRVRGDGPKESAISRLTPQQKFKLGL